MGPPPVTSQRVPGRAPPARVMPCSATAIGSASAACFDVNPSGMRSSCAAGMVLYRANAPCQSPSSVPTRPRITHSDGRCATQYSHVPQRGDGPPTTRSPGCQSVTASPTATIVPLYSWPSIAPSCPPHSSRKCRSEPQIPQWLTSTSTSFGPDLGPGSILDADVPQAHEHRGGHRGGKRFGHGRALGHAGRVART